MKNKNKNKRVKELLAYTGEEDRIHKKDIYIEAKREAKKVVAAKSSVYEDFYQRLDNKEEKKHIFRHAKAMSRQRQDLGTVKYIKDEEGRVLLRQEDIKFQWR